jgi:hypothetical protein
MVDILVQGKQTILRLFWIEGWYTAFGYQRNSVIKVTAICYEKVSVGKWHAMNSSGWEEGSELERSRSLGMQRKSYIGARRAFPHQLVLCSWLSLLSNTQAVLSSSLSGIIFLLFLHLLFWSIGCTRLLR